MSKSLPATLSVAALLLSGCKSEKACKADSECPIDARCDDTTSICVALYENFDLLPISSTVFVRQGGTASIPFAVHRFDRVQLPIELSLQSPPDQLTFTANPLKSDQTSGALEIAAAAALPVKDYQVTFVAAAGTTTRTQTVQITVTEPNAALWDAMNWDQANWN
ncbi:MAG: hypothetical protein ACT4TC_19050 [Myxococcaceae bacterium]